MVLSERLCSLALDTWTTESVLRRWWQRSASARSSSPHRVISLFLQRLLHIQNYIDINSFLDHYDYGMRAVKTVITAAGNLKRAAPEANEEALLMRALQDVNTPKFLAHDLPLFAGILNDLFPGVERPPFDYGPLLDNLKEAIAERNLQPIQIFLKKNIELYEMICVRHGLMVVGPTGTESHRIHKLYSIVSRITVDSLGGGKSENIRVLCSALSKLKAKGIEGERFERTKIYHLNPKSVQMGQLYGEFDENTHEWRDGILCVLIRKCIKEDNSNLKWMLFDVIHLLFLLKCPYFL